MSAATPVTPTPGDRELATARRPSLARRALSRIRGWRRAGVAAVILVPLAFAGLGLAALGDPAAGAERVPVALVNDDEMVTQTGPDGEETIVLAGRQLVTELTGPDSPADLDWRLTNGDDAADLLAAGEVYAVLTIPEDFSEAVLSIQSDDPQQAEIEIRTDDARSYVAAPIADALGQGMVAAFGEAVTEQFIVGVLGQVGDAFTQSADGARQLAAGAGEAAAGADEFASGVDRYTDGVTSLASGIDELEAGAQGLDQLAAGTRDYTDGVAQLSAQIAQTSAALQADPTDPQLLGTLAYLSGLLQQAAAGGDQLVAGTASAVDGVQGGLAQTSTGAWQLANNGGALDSGAADLAAGVGALAAGADELATGLEDGAAQFADPHATEELAAVASDPVGYDVSTDNPVDGTSSAIATTLVPLGLWIGALVAYLAVPPVSRRVLASSAGSGRLLLSGLARAGAVTAAQAVLLVGLLHLAAGVGWHLLPATLAFSLVAAAAFTAFHAVLVVAWGRPGLIGSFLLLAVQLAASGTILPAQALAPAFGALSPYLPLTWATTGLQQILTTGSASVAIGSAVALVLFGAASVAVATVALRRTRRAAALGLLPA